MCAFLPVSLKKRSVFQFYLSLKLFLFGNYFFISAAFADKPISKKYQRGAVMRIVILSRIESTICLFGTVMYVL